MNLGLEERDKTLKAVTGMETAAEEGEATENDEEKSQAPVTIIVALLPLDFSSSLPNL